MCICFTVITICLRPSHSIYSVLRKHAHRSLFSGLWLISIYKLLKLVKSKEHWLFMNLCISMSYWSSVTFLGSIFMVKGQKCFTSHYKFITASDFCVNFIFKLVIISNLPWNESWLRYCMWSQLYKTMTIRMGLKE